MIGHGRPQFHSNGHATSVSQVMPNIKVITSGIPLPHAYGAKNITSTTVMNANMNANRM